jgi:hypothetical protein
MYRNPSRAVGHYMRHENSPRVKDAILTWKRAVRSLAPDDPDPDLTNVESFRPDGSRSDGTATFMGDAMIPGFLAMTPQAKQNWPLGEPTVDTAVAQARRAAKRAGHGHSAKPVKVKRPATPAQLAALERANAAKRAKAAAAQGTTPQPAAEE